MNYSLLSELFFKCNYFSLQFNTYDINYGDLLLNDKVYSAPTTVQVGNTITYIIPFFFFFKLWQFSEHFVGSLDK